MEWLPIESAPKDGTPILVYLDGKTGIASIRLREGYGNSFLGSAEAWSQPTLDRNEPFRIFMGGFNATDATHWQPLPSPPSQDPPT